MDVERGGKDVVSVRFSGDDEFFWRYRWLLHRLLCLTLSSRIYAHYFGKVQLSRRMYFGERDTVGLCETIEGAQEE